MSKKENDWVYNSGGIESTLSQLRKVVRDNKFTPKNYQDIVN
jgi:hypothetical protein